MIRVNESVNTENVPDAREVRVHLVSLGCPKNLVDSEVILGGLGSRGLVITSDPEAADVIVVNTCSFIEAAKEESIQTILEACELKSQSATPKKVVVTGCMSQRYGPELRREIPELDAIVGLGEYANLADALLGLLDDPSRTHYKVSDPTRACFAEVGRFRLTPEHYAYLRISEGCDNPCTFCSIPSFRGRFRSKPIPMVIEEAEELVASGAREIVLISQDTTSYGVDIDGTFQLARLLNALGDVHGVDWIRLLYAYPAYTTDAMIDAIASVPKVLPYVDIPLQHISDPMLRRMGRRMNEAKTRSLLERMRERIPNLYLRTTFIVGFPGETDAQFRELCDFTREFRFERLGVFTYSPEENTPSAGFPDQIPEAVREERLEELMLIQQEIAFAKNRERRGEVTEAIVDSVDEDENGRTVLTARSYGEAPEIDPVILVPVDESHGEPLTGAAPAGFVEIPVGGARGLPRLEPVRTGDIIPVRIVGHREYDLIARRAAAR